MIRVGFMVTTGKWLGGINYLRNLLYAISQIEDRQIEAVVFLGAKGPADIKEMFSRQATVITTPLLDRYSPYWSLWKIFDLLGLGDVIMEPFLLKHGLRVLSHSGRVGFKRIKSVNWIPDFQQRHLPEMFSTREITAWDRWCRMILEKSDRVILSSHDALKDAMAFVPEAASKMSVLQFVAQPDRNIFDASADDLNKIKQKYGLPQEFCYLPNQFWKHKNHLVVFEALRRLKNEGYKVMVVCSGPMEDSRNPGYMDVLKKFIDDHHLQENIFLLGKIPFNDVGLLYAACTVVINPSLFEGWSTSVEEAKSMGKRILLSDIPVHREQAPGRGTYFDPHDAGDLVFKLREALAKEDTSMFLKPSKDLENYLNERTKVFGKSFQKIILGVSN